MFSENQQPLNFSLQLFKKYYWFLLTIIQNNDKYFPKFSRFIQLNNSYYLYNFYKNGLKISELCNNLMLKIIRSLQISSIEQNNKILFNLIKSEQTINKQIKMPTIAKSQQLSCSFCQARSSPSIQDVLSHRFDSERNSMHVHEREASAMSFTPSMKPIYLTL